MKYSIQTITLIQLLFFLFSAPIIAQPGIEWDRSYGGMRDEYCESIIQTSDSGFLIVGVTASFGEAGPFLGWAIKVDADGDSLWAYRFGGGRDNSKFYGVYEVVDDGYFLLGAKPGQDANVYWIVKIDSDGELDWEETFEGENGDGIMARCTAMDGDGSFYIAGNDEDENFHVMKIDQDLDIVWIFQPEEEGDQDSDDIIVLEDGNILVSGRSEEHSEETGVIFKLDSEDGDEIWRYEYNREGRDMPFYALAEDDENNIIAGGPMGLIILDEEGEFVDSRSFSNEQNADHRLRRVTNILILPEGRYIVAGEDVLLHLDSDLVIEWGREVDMDHITDLTATDDGGYAFISSDWLDGDREDYNFHAIKTDPDPRMGIPQFSELPDFEFEEDGELFISREFLYEYVVDSNDADSLMTFALSEADQIVGRVTEEGVILNTITEDWWGRDSAQIWVIDPDENFDVTWLKVDVLPVNDLPSSFNLTFPADGYELTTPDIAMLWQEAAQNEMELDEVCYTLFFELDDRSVEFPDIEDVSYYIDHIGDILDELGVDEDYDRVTLTWGVVAVDSDSSTECNERFQLVAVNPNTVEREFYQPVSFGLQSVYPNPFNSSTSISYGISKTGMVSLEVFNSEGRLITQIVNSMHSAGGHIAVWHAQDQPAGIYYLRLVSGAQTSVLKTVLIR